MSKKNSLPAGIPQSRATAWQEVLIVCRKCSRKLKGGFGDNGSKDLGTVMRDELREIGRRREVRVVESRCLGICPKNGVAALRGSNPGTVLVVPAGQSSKHLLQMLAVE